MARVILGKNPEGYLIPLESEKPLALTMNFPQHHSPTSNSETTTTNFNQIKDSKQHSHINHITTDPHGCLDCITTMFGPNYAPFAAFMQQFSDFAKNQNAIATRQSHLIENLVSYYQQRNTKKIILNQQELEYLFSHGTWSNGKHPLVSNPRQFISNRWCLILVFICTTLMLLTASIVPLFMSIYLATMRDSSDPVLAFVRAHSETHGDQFHYFKIIFVLIVIGVVNIISLIGYVAGFLGNSTAITKLTFIFNLFNLFVTLALLFIILFMNDRMIPMFSIVLQENTKNFESDNSTNSLSYSWTLMHQKYHCCVDGILETGQTVAQKSPTFAALHPGWLVPSSCCHSNVTICVGTPTVNNSFINSSCIEPTSRRFGTLLSTLISILIPIVFSIMLSNVNGIFYVMRLNTARRRMNLNNNELAKTLFALKSRHIAGIHSDITKQSLDDIEQFKTDRSKTQQQQGLRIPGYFSITPTILQVRKPEQNTYLHYEQ